MKQKYVRKSKQEILNWVEIANLFAKSLITSNTALKQFNLLLPEQRIQINDEMRQYDEIRRKKLPLGENAEEWEMSVMVDLHIIATEFDIDPLVVAMCIKPICKVKEQVFCK